MNKFLIPIIIYFMFLTITSATTPSCKELYEFACIDNACDETVMERANGFLELDCDKDFSVDEPDTNNVFDENKESNEKLTIDVLKDLIEELDEKIIVEFLRELFKDFDKESIIKLVNELFEDSQNEQLLWQPTKPRDLVGHCGMRTNKMGNDSSFMDDPVFIESVTESGHMFVKIQHISHTIILSPLWNDDAWVKVPDHLCHF